MVIELNYCIYCFKPYPSTRSILLRKLTLRNTLRLSCISGAAKSRHRHWRRLRRRGRLHLRPRPRRRRRRRLRLPSTASSSLRVPPPLLPAPVPARVLHPPAGFRARGRIRAPLGGRGRRRGPLQRHQLAKQLPLSTGKGPFTCRLRDSTM